MSITINPWSPRSWDWNFLHLAICIATPLAIMVDANAVISHYLKVCSNWVTWTPIIRGIFVMLSDAFVVLKGFFYPRTIILEMDGGGSCGSWTSMENSLLRVSIFNSYELGWKPESVIFLLARKFKSLAWSPCIHVGRIWQQFAQSHKMI